MAERTLEPAAALLQQLAAIHDRRGAAGVRVVPVLVDPDSPVPAPLQAFIVAHGGVFLDTSSDEFSGPIAGNAPSPELHAAVTEALSITASWAPRTLVIDTANGLVDATFAEIPTPDAGSEAELGLLHLARGVLHPSLREAQIAAISYKESGMASDYRRAAWRLVEQLNRIDMGVLRTLVLLVQVESGIDVPLHCQFPYGFRLAHIGGRLIVRNPREALDMQTAHLARQQSPLVLFLGAGFSFSSGLPLGNYLRDLALRSVLGINDDETFTSTQLAERFQEAQSGRLLPHENVPAEEFARTLTFERVMFVEKQSTPDLPTLADFLELEQQVLASAPSLAVASLHQIIRSHARPLVIVTVNLDRLIETAVADDVQVFATDAEFENAAAYLDAYIAGTETKVPVLKLHGTISDFESCIVTLEQTTGGLPPAKLAAVNALVGDQGHRFTWVYVGASMRDLDLNQELRSTRFATGTSEFWVLPHLIDSVEEFARERPAHWDHDPVALKELQNRLVTETADVFMHSLSSHWKS